MEFIDIVRIPTKGGSIRGFVQLAGGPRPVSENIAELVEIEENLRLDRVETFQAFTSKLEGIKSRLLSLLNGFKSRGKTIAGYGASTTVTTLLYYFDLGNIINFIVDDNPIKQNTFSPGYHIPVLPPQAIYEHHPDYVLILAWAYSDPIMTKHRNYLNLGGHFITPLPDIKVI